MLGIGGGLTSTTDEVDQNGVAEGGLGLEVTGALLDDCGLFILILKKALFVGNPLKGKDNAW